MHSDIPVEMWVYKGRLAEERELWVKYIYRNSASHPNKEVYGEGLLFFDARGKFSVPILLNEDIFNWFHEMLGVREDIVRYPVYKRMFTNH